MKTAVLFAAALLACAAAAAESLEVRGSTAARLLVAPHVEALRAASDVDLVIAPRGTGQAVLDVIDGQASVALVAGPLTEAVAAAREAAWADGRILMVGERLAFHPIASVDNGARELGFVTAAAPSPQLERVLGYFRSEAGSRELAARRPR